jgi:hypothetical protein
MGLGGRSAHVYSPKLTIIDGNQMKLRKEGKLKKQKNKKI